jgi:hypothetical protein
MQNAFASLMPMQPASSRDAIAPIAAKCPNSNLPRFAQFNGISVTLYKGALNFFGRAMHVVC